ncbi:hypothetical protein CONCODRAFT_85564 [Conidiobolus coronatus NRRL 28638]|uniref:Uncharacterized protein n=1 Tax=Conidiobolus coronatus (strain ATCC 28846 / CBS 209.66 / NRRL 28638) TaxID=796925 RepID=A0A137P515_CONC2|nr:hypothetical protein CONCODRAFT_85564 [Conidiobolus coronatus NRRL 28638]|eukprot:KXN70021.1 hypothetical protein CONCODRAFT_85564 [Conidiobolus coronatus NRRL 28638]
MYTKIEDFSSYIQQVPSSSKLINNLIEQSEYKNFNEINFMLSGKWFTFGIILKPPKIIKSSFGNGYLFTTLLCLLSFKKIPIFIDIKKKVECCKLIEDKSFKLFDFLLLFNPILLSPSSVDGGSIGLMLDCNNNNISSSKYINESFINLGPSKGFKFCNSISNLGRCDEVVNSDKGQDYCNNHLMETIYKNKRMDLATSTFGPLIKLKSSQAHSSCYELNNEERLFPNQQPKTKETEKEKKETQAIRNSLKSIGNYSSKLLSAASEQLGNKQFKPLKDSKITKKQDKKANSNKLTKQVENANKKESGLSPLELLKLYHVKSKDKKEKVKNDEEFELIIE